MTEIHSVMECDVPGCMKLGAFAWSICAHKVWLQLCAEHDEAANRLILEMVGRPKVNMRAYRERQRRWQALLDPVQGAKP